MNISYYFPTLGKVIGNLYYLRYVEIESDVMRERAIREDIYTRLLTSGQYWTVLHTDMDSPSVDVIRAFVETGAAGSIIAVYIPAEDRVIGESNELTNKLLRLLPGFINKKPHPLIELCYSDCL